jgi:hypothetical protein
MRHSLSRQSNSQAEISSGTSEINVASHLRNALIMEHLNNRRGRPYRVKSGNEQIDPGRRHGGNGIKTRKRMHEAMCRSARLIHPVMGVCQ